MGSLEGDTNIPTVGQLKDLLVGRSIEHSVVVDRVDYPGVYGPVGIIGLSDGTNLMVWGNDGCPACPSGEYVLEYLANSTNVITNVEVDNVPGYDEPCAKHDGAYDCECSGWYRVFVVAADERVRVMSFEGGDGLGYYGSGWWLRILNRGGESG